MKNKSNIGKDHANHRQEAVLGVFSSRLSMWSAGVATAPAIARSTGMTLERVTTVLNKMIRSALVEILFFSDHGEASFVLTKEGCRSIKMMEKGMINNG